MPKSEEKPNLGMPLVVPNYNMPKVGLGTCLWRNAPNAEPVVALITQVRPRSIACLVFAPGSRVGMEKMAVRHISDPDLRKVLQHDGCWDYTDAEARLRSNT